ncbi:MAG: OsmC family protein [Haliscomenobacter sp.]|nr:OsmC family protein [Haliscomenobacter sp.]MBP9078123.1 OsmC family protein [Haliscomenobacter sp.]
MASSTSATITEVNVRLDNENGFTTTVQSGPHQLLSDEPEDAGGKNLGMAPYQLLGSALGSCTAMTLHIYARHKQWPLHSVTVRLQHQKKHVEDCKDCDNPKARLDHFDLFLHLEGPLSEDQKARLKEIAYKCPVHKTLTNKNVINIQIEE